MYTIEQYISAYLLNDIYSKRLRHVELKRTKKKEKRKKRHVTLGEYSPVFKESNT